MPSISAWQRVNRVLCCLWLALLLSCPRTGPVHQEISMLRPSQALLSCWPGRDPSTMQTKSLPTPYIIWRLKVRPKRRTISLCFSYELKRVCWELRGMKVWKDAKWQQETTISYFTLSHLISFPWRRPSVVTAQSRGQGEPWMATSLK